MGLSIISPLEYLQLCEASYKIEFLPEDGRSDKSLTDTEIATLNLPDGWNKVINVSNKVNGYRGAVLVDDARQQVVLVHTGSQNLDSWVTDIESVVLNKPGDFVKTALGQALQTAIEYQHQGYELSTTGHSLGGFLAQITAYWANRDDQVATFDPTVSAVVFDSPGAKAFLDHADTHLVAEKMRVAQLNVHNFCARPTAVSTYGDHVGSVWYLQVAPDGLKFPFLESHKLTEIKKGFDPVTGKPNNAKRMKDWPSTDYVSSLTGKKGGGSSSIFTKTGAAKFVGKLVFDVLDSAYSTLREKMGYQPRDSWYTRIFKGGPNQYQAFKKSVEKAANGSDSEIAKLEGALVAHFVEQPNQRAIPARHFTPEQQAILLRLEGGRFLGEEFGWQEKIKQQCGEDALELLEKFRFIASNGTLNESQSYVVLDDKFAGDVFDFMQQFPRVFNDSSKIPAVESHLLGAAKKTLAVQATTDAGQDSKISALEQKFLKLKEEISKQQQKDPVVQKLKKATYIQGGVEVNAKSARVMSVRQEKTPEEEERRGAAANKFFKDVQSKADEAVYKDGVVIVEKNASGAQVLHVDVPKKEKVNPLMLMEGFFKGDAPAANDQQSSENSSAPRATRGGGDE